MKIFYPFIAIAFYFFMASALTACKGGGGETSPDAAADSLAAQAMRAHQAGDDMLAKTLIDSLNNTYPQALDARRQVTGILPEVMDGFVQAQFPAADARIAAAQAVSDSLDKLMTMVVDSEDGSAYFVVKDAATSPVQPRVDAKLFGYCVNARNTGAPLGLNSITLRADDGSECSTTPVPAGSERAFSEAGAEVAVIMNEEVETIGPWAVGHNVTGVTLVGTAGTRDARLTPAQAAAFATAWRYAQARDELRSALIEREKLQRQLEVAQRQVREMQPAGKD